jgi:hypothetical protein
MRYRYTYSDGKNVDLHDCESNWLGFANKYHMSKIKRAAKRNGRLLTLSDKIYDHSPPAL